MTRQEFERTFAPTWDVSSLEIKNEHLHISGWRNKRGGKPFFTTNFGFLGKHYRSWDDACDTLYKIYCEVKETAGSAVK